MVNPRSKMLMQTQHLTLDAPPDAIAIGERELERYSNNGAAWNAYINCLAMEALLPWLQEVTTENVRPRFDYEERAHLWEFLNGTAIHLEKTRLILLPTEEKDRWFIPQEWVDIPELIADYYLPTYVNLAAEEECEIEILGYVTHQELKNNGEYDRVTRTYSPSQRDFIEDITLLFLARQVVGDCTVAVAPLPSLTLQRQQELQEELSHPSVWNPRLTASFEEWGALINNPRGRSELYRRRLAAVESEQEPIVSLSHWFDNLRQGLQVFAEKGWQTVEKIAQELGGDLPEFAYYAGSPNFRDGTSHLSRAVPGLLELLESHPDKETELATLHLLGQIGYGNGAAIALLSRLLYKTKDGEIRRQAAVSLGRIDPANPLAGIRRIKIMDFGMCLDGTKVAVGITLLPEGQRGMNVNLRVYPITQQKYLPEALKLSVLDENGDVFESAKAREADIALQLDFKGERGDRFILKVLLGEIDVTERFSI
ncbi:MAG: DUF1822 family protein [Cyanobacteria bacterium SBLK]|nr:DUF1822 family protein [Cyanobacteria bacterium SBLK]